METDLSSRLGLGVVNDFNKFRMETSAKNIGAFMPVVSKIIKGFCTLSDKAVSKLPSAFFLLIAKLDL